MPSTSLFHWPLTCFLDRNKFNSIRTTSIECCTWKKPAHGLHLGCVDVNAVVSHDAPPTHSSTKSCNHLEKLQLGLQKGPSAQPQSDQNRHHLFGMKAVAIASFKQNRCPNVQEDAHHERLRTCSEPTNVVGIEGVCHRRVQGHPGQWSQTKQPQCQPCQTLGVLFEHHRHQHHGHRHLVQHQSNGQRQSMSCMNNIPCEWPWCAWSCCTTGMLSNAACNAKPIKMPHGKPFQVKV